MELGRASYSLSEGDVNVGAFSSIAGGVRFHAACNHPSIRVREAVSNFPFKEKWNVDYPESAFGKGSINVGNDVWIAEGARILDGVTIGDGAIVAAQAVVTKDVPPYAMVAGNPAKVKKYRFSDEVIDLLLKIKWWTWSDDEIKDRIKDFWDVNNFVKKYGRGL